MDENNNALSNSNPACEPITTFLKKLTTKGFVMLDNGNYVGEPGTRPDPESLYFRLQSPINLEVLDVSDDAYYLAGFGKNTYMCECHYHMVKLVN